MNKTVKIFLKEITIEAYFSNMNSDIKDKFWNYVGKYIFKLLQGF